MKAIAWTVIGVGVAIIAVAQVWSVARVRKDSPGEGTRFYLGYGLFQIRYIISNWDRMRSPTLLGLAGGLVFGVGVWLAKSSHVFR